MEMVEMVEMVVAVVREDLVLEVPLPFIRITQRQAPILLMCS